MTDGKINASEYKIVSNCLLAMWMDEYIKDREYYKIMNKLNEYAKKCGIVDKVEVRNNNENNGD